MYNILVLGSGGREHAVSWKLAQSPKCKHLYIAPGNAGTKKLGTNLDLDILNFKSVETAIDTHQVDFLFVGPEAPLVEGIYDHFKNHRVCVIGPSKEASRLEGSKSFANAFMEEYGIPTAGSININKSNLDEGISFLRKKTGKIVLKADGLAAGKGVLILEDNSKAEQELIAMINGKFGEASANVVIEEFLDGIEFSVFVLTDGNEYKVLPIAKDYKRIGEGDTGLNTGGMGAISPVSFVDQKLWEKVESKIIEPTIRGLKSRNYIYEGFIFFGLIKVGDEPYVIEYNCRLGDPETEVIIPRINSDLVELFEALRDNTLDNYDLVQSSLTAATVMLVSGGYPESYKKGMTINIGNNVSGSILFHAGTKISDGKLVTNGGRVMAVSSLANDKEKAIELSLKNIEKIHFQNMNFRSDIGFDL